MPGEFPDTATTRLTTQEADYLAERILAEAPSSVFAFVVRYFEEQSDVPYVWEHPLAAAFPAPLRDEVAHARNFAEIMQGASILYNLLLARMPPDREELLDTLREEFGVWRALMLERRDVLLFWDRLQMWRLLERSGARIGPLTRQFVETWIDLVREASDPQSPPCQDS